MAPNSATTKLAAAKKKARAKERREAAEVRAAAAEYALFEARQKAAKKRREMEAIEHLYKAMNIRTALSPMPIREFDSFTAFFSTLTDYCADNSTSYSVRDSNASAWKNAKLLEAYEDARRQAAAKNVEFTEELHLVPMELGYSMRKFRCVHGTYSPDNVPPGERQRQQVKTRYTGCKARVTAEAQRVLRDGEWTWRVFVREEHSVHNHVCSPAIFDSYSTSSAVGDEVLLGRALSQISAGGNSRAIREELSAGLGVPFSAKQYQNLKQKLLGGGVPADNLDTLIEEYLSEEGSRVIVIHDADGNIIGIILQTAIQREFHRRFGDSLLLDWTHNTNNCGLYLGCLMATSATGKGVPVLDFLCMSQSVDMMRTVLEVFVEDSQDAVDVVESFVIDKDYKEWKAVSAVFTEASVVLCQFHVVKWFKSVVADSRYSIPLADRPRVLKFVRQMMYAETEEDFLTFKSRLFTLLPPKTHRKFQAYMDSRWFSCKRMWANHLRGKVFTAGNTTTNRLESHWNQLKAMLGKNRRIDRCVEAVFRRETIILKRELEELVTSTATTQLHPNDHIFTRGLLQDLSATRAKLVKAQWNKYLARSERFTSPDGLGDDGSCNVFPSSTAGRSVVVYTSDEHHWKCSCRFATSYKLPCRHQFFVAHALQGLATFPTHALALRWSMRKASELIEPLRAAVDFLGGVRLIYLLASPHPAVDANNPVNGDDSMDKSDFDDADDSMDANDSEDARDSLGANDCAVTTEGCKSMDGEPPVTGARLGVTVFLHPRKKLGFRRLRLGERADRTVSEPYEKRRYIQDQCDRVAARLMNFGTARFWHASNLLESVLSSFLSSLEIRDDENEGSKSTTEPTQEPLSSKTMQEEMSIVDGADLVTPQPTLEDGRCATFHASAIDEEEYSSALFYEDDRAVDSGTCLGSVMAAKNNASSLMDEVGSDSCFDEDEDDSEDEERYLNNYSSQHLGGARTYRDIRQTPIDVMNFNTSVSYGPVRFAQLDDDVADLTDLLPSSPDGKALASALSSMLIEFPGESAIAEKKINSLSSSPCTAQACDSSSTSTLRPVCAMVGASSPSSVHGCMRDFSLENILNAEDVDADSVADDDSVAVDNAKGADRNSDSVEIHSVSPTTIQSLSAAAMKTSKRARSGVESDGEGGSGFIHAKKKLKTSSGIRGTFKKLPFPLPGRARNSKQQPAKRAPRLVLNDSEPKHSSALGSVLDLRTAVRYAPLPDARKLTRCYPRDFDDLSLAGRPITVTLETGYVPAMKVLITASAVDTVLAAINAKRADDEWTRRAEDGEARCPEEVDLASDLLVAEGATVQCEHTQRERGQYVARILGTAIVVSEQSAEAMSAFYADRSFLLKIDNDRTWLSDKKSWDSLRDLEVSFLDGYAKECAKDASEERDHVQVMCELLLERLDGVSLNTVVETNSRSTNVRIRDAGVQVRELAGRLSHSTWLNDSTVALSLAILASRFPDVTVVDSLVNACTKLPAQRLTQQRLVVFPLNFGSQHWCEVLVVLDWQRGHRAFMYEPLGQMEKYGPRLEKAWAERIVPLFDKWFARDKLRYTDTLGSIQREVICEPRQTDGFNCGVFCIAQALCFMDRDFRLHNLEGPLSPGQLKLMRLRIMYMILCKARTRIDETLERHAAEALTLFKSSEAWKSFE